MINYLSLGFVDDINAGVCWSQTISAITFFMLSVIFHDLMLFLLLFVFLFLILLGRVRWLGISTSKEEVTTLFLVVGGGGCLVFDWWDYVLVWKRENFGIRCVGGWPFHSGGQCFSCLFVVSNLLED